MTIKPVDPEKIHLLRTRTPNDLTDATEYMVMYGVRDDIQFGTPYVREDLHKNRVNDLLDCNNRYQSLYRELKQKPKVTFVKQKIITRRDCQTNLDKLYLFGDNGNRIGYGGQAGEMRDEPNAHGIATKPLLTEFMKDVRPSHWSLMLGDIRTLEIRLWAERPKFVVIPEDGLGTGLAELPWRAPRIFERLNHELAELEKTYGSQS